MEPEDRSKPRMPKPNSGSSVPAQQVKWEMLRIRVRVYRGTWFISLSTTTLIIVDSRAVNILTECPNLCTTLEITNNMASCLRAIVRRTFILIMTIRQTLLPAQILLLINREGSVLSLPWILMKTRYLRIILITCRRLTSNRRCHLSIIFHKSRSLATIRITLMVRIPSQKRMPMQERMLLCKCMEITSQLPHQVQETIWMTRRVIKQWLLMDQQSQLGLSGLLMLWVLGIRWLQVTHKREIENIRLVIIQTSNTNLNTNQPINKTLIIRNIKIWWLETLDPQLHQKTIQTTWETPEVSKHNLILHTQALTLI